MKDFSTVAAVCDDSLGGFTAIDPRKFAHAFIERRRADIKAGPSSWASLENVNKLVLTRDVKKSADEWINVKPTQKGGKSQPTSVGESDMFVPVQGKKKKGKK